MTNMPLDEKAKEEIRKLFKNDPLMLISLTSLETVEVLMAIIASSIWDKTIKKYLKKGTIPTKAYEANEEAICKWEIAKENTEYFANEIKEQIDMIQDQSQMLAKIETDPFYARAYANSKSGFAERRDKAVEELKEAEEGLANNSKDLPSLEAQVSKLRDFDFLREKGYV